MTAVKLGFEYWNEAHDFPLHIFDIHELYGKKFVVYNGNKSYRFDFSILGDDGFYYYDGTGVRQDLDLTDFRLFDYGKEGCLLRDSDNKMCIKIFHRMMMDVDTAKQLSEIPSQKGLMLLEHSIFNNENRFSGFTNPYMAPIDNLYDFKCHAFIDYYKHIQEALKVLGLNYGVLADDILSVNFLFTDNEMLLHDPGDYRILHGMNPRVVAAANMLNLDTAIPRVYGKILLDCATVLDGSVPIRGDDGLIAEARSAPSKIEYFERELGSFETFPDYLCNKYPRLVKISGK